MKIMEEIMAILHIKYNQMHSNSIEILQAVSLQSLLKHIIKLEWQPAKLEVKENFRYRPVPTRMTRVRWKVFGEIFLHVLLNRRMVKPGTKDNFSVYASQGTKQWWWLYCKETYTELNTRAYWKQLFSLIILSTCTDFSVLWIGEVYTVLQECLTRCVVQELESHRHFYSWSIQ